MADIIVTAPNGVRVHFPEGTTMDEIRRAMEGLPNAAGGLASADVFRAQGNATPSIATGPYGPEPTGRTTADRLDPGQTMLPDPGAAGVAAEGQMPGYWQPGQTEPGPPQSLTAQVADMILPRYAPETPDRTWVNNLRGHTDAAGSVATLGLWPYIQALYDDATSSLNYREALQNVYNNMDLARQQSPFTMAGAEAAGAMVPVAGAAGFARTAAMPATTAAQFGRQVAEAAPQAAAPLYQQVLGGGAAGGAAGGTYGFAEGLGRSGGDLNEAAQTALDYAVPGAVVGGGVPLFSAMIPAISRAIGRTGAEAGAGAVARGATVFSEESLRSAAGQTRTAMQNAYRAADEAGITVAPYDLVDTLTTVQTGLRTNVNNPEAMALINRFLHGDENFDGIATRNAGIPLSQVEDWRQQVNAAIRSHQTPDGGIDAAGLPLIQIRDALDRQVLQLLEYSPARELYLNTIRLDSLAEAATRATDRAAQSPSLSYEDAFRRQLLRLKESDAWGRFTQEQQDAIDQVIRDRGPLQSLDNIFNTILGTGIRRAFANVAGAGLAATGHGIGFAIPPLMGTATNMARNASTRTNLNNMVNTVTGQPQVPYITQELIRQLDPARYTMPALIGRQTPGGGF